MEHSHRYLEARRVTLIGLAVNILLTLIKLFFGVVGHSHALFADGIHTLSDLLSDFLVLFAARAGSRGADIDHPYGHARIETAATVVVAMLLIFAGGGIIFDSGLHLYEAHTPSHPNVMVLWVAAFSVAANEIIYYYTLQAAKKIKSDLLRAHAWHRRSDAASSLVVLVGIGLSLLNFPLLDPFAAVIVGGMIIKMGWDLGWSSVRELVDTGLDEKTIKKISKIIGSVSGVRMLHQLRSRTMGQSVLVDVHIQVDPYLSVSEGHYIGQQVHLVLMQEIPSIVDVTVHVDPEDDEIAPATSNLPPREEIVKKLMRHWKNIMGANKIHLITTHYLAGKIQVIVVLPLEFAPDKKSAEELTQKYREAIKDLPEIASLQLFFNI